MDSEVWVELFLTWSGKTYTLRVAESDRSDISSIAPRIMIPSTADRVFDLKAVLYNLTKVPPERQKILGLVKGKLPPDQGRMYVLCIFGWFL